jgi:protein-L-isoaspartate(D-aspartate) O-methyltransferase
MTTKRRIVNVQGAVAPCTVALLVALVAPASAQTERQFEALRQRMVDESIVGAGVTNERVIDSMRKTPRHEFVLAADRKSAYHDMAIPIGEGQTISAPFIVGYMTEAIDPEPGDKVLEIGTGSGYQAAVLSPLVKEVYTIEIVEPLAARAERALKRLKYDNVHVKAGDGFLGWPDAAPFDKIIVTCSPEKVPQPLFDQLKDGGLMVIPVGERYQQTLYLLRKTDGKLEAEELLPTLFVPMTGAAEDIRRVKPDPLNPQIVNGGFEEDPPENGYVPGWYYQQQFSLETDNKTPQGSRYVTFQNREPGRASHMMQAFPIDGREIKQLGLSAWVKYEDVSPGRHRDELPMVAVTFYDEKRKDLGTAWLGPFPGTSDWREESKTVRVPPEAREAILRIGLFGGVGKVSYDRVRIEVQPE